MTHWDLAPLSRRRFLWLFSLGLAAAGLGPRTAWAADRWLQNHRETELWSSWKPDAQLVERAPQWSYFKQLADQEGPRFAVEHPTTKARVYLDADAVGPSGAPPAGWAYRGGQSPAPAPSAAAPQQPAAPAAQPAQPAPAPQVTVGSWVTLQEPGTLWSAPSGGIVLGTVDRSNVFQATDVSKKTRFRVRDPVTEAQAYLDAKLVVLVARPPEKPPVPARWWGTVGSDDINVRSAPNSDGELLGRLPKGLPVSVEEFVGGQEVLPDQPTWAKLAEGVYVYGPLLRKAWNDTPPTPIHAPLGDKWVDVNLTHQTVTAYEGEQPVYMAVTSSGRPGWETHEGVHTVFYRVERETMDSNSLVGRDASRASYRIENIRWTQYFTKDGQALHENFWRDPDLFGVPSSHGCLGMVAQDALWFWLWGERGMQVSVHY